MYRSDARRSSDRMDLGGVGMASYQKSYGAMDSVAAAKASDRRGFLISAAPSVERVRNGYLNEMANVQGRQDMAASVTNSHIEFQVNGAGESVVTVYFKNVTYIEKPVLVGFGSYMRDWNAEANQRIGNKYPTISIVCVDYVVQDLPPVTRLYTGAKLAVVTTGNTYQKMIVNCSFSGMALGGPTKYSPVPFVNPALLPELQFEDPGETIYNEYGEYI